MAITTRETTATGVVNKDAPLTNAEVDQNFIELAQSKSDVGHGHTIADITNLQVTLDGKAAVSHGHAWADITSGVPATATRWPTWSEVTSKPTNIIYLGDYGIGGNTPILTAPDFSSYAVGLGVFLSDYNGNVNYPPTFTDSITNILSFGQQSYPAQIAAQAGGKIAFRAESLANLNQSAWNEIYHTGHKPTPAEIGAAPASHSHSYLPLSGGLLTGDVEIVKNNPWLTLDSSWSGGVGVEQGAGISVGESGKKGNAAIHMTYTGDGRGWIGMGSVNSTTGIPAYVAMEFFYTSNEVQFKNTPNVNGSLVYHEGHKPTPAEIGAAPVSHGHSWGDLSGIPATATRWPTWSEVTSKPSTFNPSAHSHSAGDLAASLVPATASELPGSVNLNNYGAGFYYQTTNADASSGTNYPAAKAGSLVVQLSAGRTQQYYTYGPGGTMYIRGEYQGSWASWSEVYHERHKPTPAEIGAASSSHSHTASDITDVSRSTGNSWQFNTSYGYVRIGPYNSNFCHFVTDRATYYFNKSVVVDGNLNRYSDNRKYTTTTVSTSNPSGGSHGDIWVKV